MREHSTTAWDIASKYSHVLASETRDLAAWIDKAIADERAACAALVEADGGRGRFFESTVDADTFDRALRQAAAAIRART